MKSSGEKDSIFLKDGPVVMWGTEKLKKCTVTGQLCNKMKSTGVFHVDPALTPEKLDLLKGVILWTFIVHPGMSSSQHGALVQYIFCTRCLPVRSCSFCFRLFRKALTRRRHSVTALCTAATVEHTAFGHGFACFAERHAAETRLRNSFALIFFAWSETKTHRMHQSR